MKIITGTITCTRLLLYLPVVVVHHSETLKRTHHSPRVPQFIDPRQRVLCLLLLRPLLFLLLLILLLTRTLALLLALLLQ